MSTPCLKIHNLQVHTLHPLSFELFGGDCIGITGPSGCGKTRFLRVLADLDPCQGEIILQGQSIRKIKAYKWRRKVALLPTESQWWFDRVGDHFDTYDIDLLQLLGFEPSVMDWPVHRLSSGEKQRLALIRLLANHPLVLLLDEPTTNLDRHHIGNVETIIRHLLEEHRICVIWVGHDRNQLLRVADQVFTIADSRLERIDP